MMRTGTGGGIPHGVPCPIVAIGASAGGLPALKAFLEALDERPAQAAFVIVTHQASGHTGMLPVILERSTSMPVQEVGDDAPLVASRLYVAGPGVELELRGGILHAEPAGSTTQVRLPIDHFLRSIADQAGDQAVAVLLSGAGSDGTLGAKAVRAEGGLVLVQSPQTAEATGMPASAIAAGVADQVGAPEDLPGIIADHLELVRAGLPSNDDEAISQILAALCERTGQDFSGYKMTTVRRRITHRMRVHQDTSLASYRTHIERDPAELDLLLRDLLIGVTRFFRDSDAFERLGEFIGKRLASDQAGDRFRAWIPGCSTGEEAYSIAILASECMARLDQPRPVQIFATDLDEGSIELARRGRYPAGIAADVAPERLARYFEADDGGFTIRKEIRERVVFAPQNVLTDPPFTRLDLVSCRNLLIYLETEAQAHVLPLFHYALRPDGLLFLGKAETASTFGSLFEPMDSGLRIYRRRSTTGTVTPPRFLGRHTTGPPGLVSTRARARHRTHGDFTIPRLLLDSFVPATVVVNPRGELIYVHGRTGRYLEPAPGQPSHNVLLMAREGLRLALNTVLRQALTQEEPVHWHDLRVQSEGGTNKVDLRAQRLTEPEQLRGLVMVSFLEPGPSTLDPTELAGGHRPEPQGIEEQLRLTRDNLQATIEELETSNEELQSTNEELQSTNEELQSANEELETSREEMQALNDQLLAVNDQLQDKINELSQVNDDMANLLKSTDIATVFLDEHLRVQRFTPQASRIFRLIASDVGRPISDLASDMDTATLVDDANEVLETLVARQRQLRSRNGTVFLMRILPYRTTDNVIAGVVLTFLDVTALRDSLAAGQEPGPADSGLG